MFIYLKYYKNAVKRVTFYKLITFEYYVFPILLLCRNGGSAMFRNLYLFSKKQYSLLRLCHCLCHVGVTHECTFAVIKQYTICHKSYKWLWCLNLHFLLVYVVNILF